MASFKHFLIGIISALTFTSLINANSLFTNDMPVVIVPTVEPTTTIDPHSCSNDTDCHGHSKCINNTVCRCDRGWTTYGNAADASTYCTYEQRSKQTAFFLSFFVGVFGIDWFYLSCANVGYIIAGILKLLLGLGCCGSWPLTYFGPELQNSESVKAKLRGVSTCFSLVAFAWWFVDWSRILANRFSDGRGAGLTPW